MTTILMVHYCVYCLLQYKIKFHKIAYIYLKLLSESETFTKTSYSKISACMYGCLWMSEVTLLTAATRVFACLLCHLLGNRGPRLYIYLEGNKRRPKEI